MLTKLDRPRRAKADKIWLTEEFDEISVAEATHKDRHWRFCCRTNSMMEVLVPIPKTRENLITQIETSFEKLDAELLGVDDGMTNEICIDSWSIKDLLAVRLW